MACVIFLSLNPALITATMKFFHSLKGKVFHNISTARFFMITCLLVKLNQFLCIMGCVSLLFLSSCYIQDGGGGGGSTQIVSFETDVAPLLSTSCASSGCHDTTSLQGNLDLSLDPRIADDVFVSIDSANLLDLETPDASKLLTQATNTDDLDPHTGGAVIDTDSDPYKTVLSWIEDGALNDDCTNVTHTFSLDVLPALSNCSTSGCHDGTEAFSLAMEDAFTTITEQELVNMESPTQSLLLRNAIGELEHTGGVIFPSVNQEEYRKIFCWIKVDEAIEN